jgi:hypothetical protein
VYGGSEQIKTSSAGLDKDMPEAYRFLDNFTGHYGDRQGDGVETRRVRIPMNPPALDQRNPDRVKEWCNICSSDTGSAAHRGAVFVCHSP